MKPQKDHSTGNSGSSAAGHISEAVNEGLVNGYKNLSKDWLSIAKITQKASMFDCVSMVKKFDVV